MKILLLDDDSLLRDMYATKFIEAGHTVEEAPDGDAALATLQEQSFDAVLLDMVMPGIDGISFIKKAKEAGGDTKTFIVLSNQSEEKDQTAAKKAGAAGYIVKAQTIPSEVVQKVEHIVTKDT